LQLIASEGIAMSVTLQPAPPVVDQPVNIASISDGDSGIRKQSFPVRALYIGEHINLRPFVPTKRVTSQQPAIVPTIDGGLAMVFRYGGVVFFDVSVHNQHAFLSELVPMVTHAYEQSEIEEIAISVDDQKADGDVSETITLKNASLERLQTVAAVLSKSVALAQYEADVAQNFEQIEPFAIQLENSGRGGRNMRQLLRHIGRTLLNEFKMVARAEVTDRPDLIWDRPDLAQLYRRLEDEFELRERAAILDRKLDLISRTVNTVVDLLQKSRSMRVEWYIVVLIVSELVLTIYQLMSKGG
jgi:required for meiotic nuclear division protein 1